MTFNHYYYPSCFHVYILACINLIDSFFDFTLPISIIIYNDLSLPFFLHALINHCMYDNQGPDFDNLKIS